jgi:hypothetical protein
MVEIVRLNEGQPSRKDIAGSLRLLAQEIESGAAGQIVSAIVLLPKIADYPAVYQFGAVDGENHPIIQCELAKHRFVANIMRRA